MSTAAVTRPGRPILRIAQALAVAGLFVYAVQSVFPQICGDDAHDLFENWLYPALFFMASGICFARVVYETTERLPWTGLAIAFFAWGSSEVGVQIVYGVDEPAFSFGDVLQGFFYLACYFAMVQLVRSRTRDFRASLWLDGVVGVLALAGLGAALIVGPLANVPDPAVATVDLAYLLADLVLLALVVGAFALCGWRPGRDLGMIGVGLLSIVVIDAFDVYMDSTDAQWVDTTMPYVLLVGGALLISFAAWQQTPQSVRVRLEGLRVVAMPACFALVGLGLVTAQAFVYISPVALGLAVASLLAAILRMSLTFRENVSLLHRTRYQAYTDALTGLENRRKLMLDLEEALPEATLEEPVAVALFDLDGFKQYNDSFGHPAGDALLARLGANLATAIEGLGSAYRLGGDEFCVLTKGDEGLMRAIIEESRQSLGEKGEAFAVASSCGLVMIPSEAHDVATALNVADERLYAHKGERKRVAVTRQTSDALVQVVREREPALGDHQSEVARLARAVGAHLGLADNEVDQLARAGELHDIGKVAIPDAILSKPGPLDELEWGLVRQHTLVGERIVAAAPTLAPIAQLVRGSHERFDGAGYPDGLSGDSIPLGSRIVAACDAYHVMICERPYRNAITSEEALEELRRCAGEQFDPIVVGALCDLLAPSDELSHNAAA